MKFIKKNGLIIYWIFLFIDCGFMAININSYRMLITPFLFPFLGIYFFANTQRSKHPRTKGYIYVFLFLASLINFAMINKGQFFVEILLALIAMSLILCRVFYKMFAVNFTDAIEAFFGACGTALALIIAYRFIKIANLASNKYLIITLFIICVGVVAFGCNVIKDKVKKSIGINYILPGTILYTIAAALIVSNQYFFEDADFIKIVIHLTTGFAIMLIMRAFTKYLKA
jgi:hypothetical protein